MESAQWNADDYARNSHGQFAWAVSVIERLKIGQSGSVELELNDVVAEGICLQLIGPGPARSGQETRHVCRRKRRSEEHGSLESASGSPAWGFYRCGRSRTADGRWFMRRSPRPQPGRT